MALASLADVKRILRIPATSVDAERDARLAGALAAVESWATRALWKISAEGANVEVYWDQPEDGTLHLPTDDVTVTKVKVFEYPSSYGVPLSPVELGLGHGYDMSDDGKLILRPTLFVSPFEGAGAQRRLRVYSRVEVHYIGTGVVPRAVTEGVAYLAAAYDTDGPRALQGLLSEKIGDYSYTVKPNGEQDYMQWAFFFLKPFMRRAKIMVV